MKTKILLLTFLLFIVSLTCSKRITTRRYYVFELARINEQVRPDTSLFDVRVDVRDFHVARAFDQTRIALRTNSNELDYYFYHHWAVKPSQAAADFVYDLFEQKNMFSGNFRGISYHPAFTIRGEIKNIERIQEDKEAFAHLSMRLELLDADTEEIVVNYEDDQYRKLQPANNMNTFALAMSEIMAQISNAFAERVRFYLEEQHAEAKR
jgi:ABC-type uncharacterized transport system auxiliary subunit